MSVLTRFTQAIGETVKFKPSRRSPRRRGGSSTPGMPGVSAMRPARAVEVKAPETRPAPSTPPEPAELKHVNKQQLITELQQNYREVIELVRKVNGRLDDQEKRAKRLLEIAERVPGAMDLIPEMNEHAARTASTLTEIADSSKAANQRAEAAAQSQTRVLEAVGDRLANSEETEQRVAGTLGDLNTTIGSMTGATDQLAVVMRGVQHRDTVRDEQVRALLGRTQKWMLAAVLVCAGSVVTSLAIALWG